MHSVTKQCNRSMKVTQVGILPPHLWQRSISCFRVKLKRRCLIFTSLTLSNGTHFSSFSPPSKCCRRCEKYNQCTRSWSPFGRHIRNVQKTGRQCIFNAKHRLLSVMGMPSSISEQPLETEKSAFRAAISVFAARTNFSWCTQEKKI